MKTAGDVLCDAGVDYLPSAHGIQVLSNGKIDATGVKVSYTPRATKLVHMLNGAQREFEMIIAGLNDAQSGEPFALQLRRVKFSLLQELPVLGQEYTKLTGPCELLADPLVTATDISKFYSMDLAEAV